nr:CPBP family intramembrane metalloprotease [Gammaproteobacteria bacterium]
MNQYARKAVKTFAPMGQAFLLVLLVNSAMWLVAHLSNPAQEYLQIELSDIPSKEKAQWRKGDKTGQALGDDTQRCQWLEPTSESKLARKQSARGESDQAKVFNIECAIPADPSANEAQALKYTKVLDSFNQSGGWEISQFGFSYRTTTAFQLGPITSLVFISLPLVVTIFLLRGVSVAQEAKNCFLILVKAPWLLILLPTVAVVGSVVFSVISSLDSATPDEIVPGHLDITMALAIVFVLPLFEESVFRQWLYSETISNLSTPVAGFLNAWFFMLTHAANPQASNGLTYLFVVFMMGFTLFWIRHRFQSFGLAAIAHITNNALFMLVAFLTI